MTTVRVVRIPVVKKQNTDFSTCLWEHKWTRVQINGAQMQSSTNSGVNKYIGTQTQWSTNALEPINWSVYALERKCNGAHIHQSANILERKCIGGQMQPSEDLK